MKTVLIQINDNKAYKLLEALSILKLLEKKTTNTGKLSEKYLGKISSKVADDLQKYVNQSRNEWKNQNI